MSDHRPNILLVMTDQQRGDCLGVAGHPVLQTPQLDELASQGVRFTRAFSTCPSCIAARRSLLSGQTPQTHGLVGYKGALPWNPPATLPGTLRNAGYHTAIVGRNMHQHPLRKRYGYDQMTIAAGINLSDDYYRWLQDRAPDAGGYYAAGPGHNDWAARPWPLAEHLHQTNWTVSQALRFLEDRDPTQPFFLTVSFLAPHPPLIPPAFYMERYLRMELPAPAIGDWAQIPDASNGQRLDASRIHLNPEALRSMQAGYFGLINHIDDQLRRLFNPPAGVLPANTIVLFTSDHGEMLGDHHMFRKSEPYQGSAHVPLIIAGPGLKEQGINAGQLRDHAVALEDIMPTCLELAGLDVPASVDGKSLVPLMRDASAELDRQFIHGEHAPHAHYLTDGKAKYIWRVKEGREQFFDLEHDPQELHDLAGNALHGQDVSLWRGRLIDRLRHRPEGFVANDQLVPGRPYVAPLPHALG